MSNTKNGKTLKGKDLITIGIFSVIYFVINFAFMLLGLTEDMKEKLIEKVVVYTGNRIEITWKFGEHPLEGMAG